MVENNRAEVLWDFQIQTDKMVMANQPDIVVVIKQQKKAVDVDRYRCSNPKWYYHQEEGSWEAWEIIRADRGARQDVESSSEMNNATKKKF